MKLSKEQIRAMIMEELQNLKNESMDHGEMAQKYYPAPSMEDEAYGEWKSALLKYMADDIQGDPVQRTEAATEAEELAYAALENLPDGPEADEIGDFLNQLYASGDLD